MTRRGTLIAVIGISVTLSIGAAASVGLGGRSDTSGSNQQPRTTTASVTRETLVDYIVAPGELDYGPPLPLRYTAPTATDSTPPPPGDEASPPSTNASAKARNAPPEDDQHIVTWLPGVGTVVSRGRPVFRVDDRPVVLLYGALPVYRTLQVGILGADVEQLETNLAALGYRGFTVDNTFTAPTAAAVRTWQHDIGAAVTGMIAPGQVVYASGAIRVAKTAIQVGDPAAGEILDYTGTVLETVVKLPMKQQQYAVKGTKPNVTLPDGKTVVGRVDAVSAPTSDPDTGGLSVEVDIVLPDQNPLGASAAAQVSVRFVADEREDALTVPVVALVALAEGGYGVQVVHGGTTQYIAVTTGLFAAGRVEITSGAVHPGMLVVVPR